MPKKQPKKSQKQNKSQKQKKTPRPREPPVAMIVRRNAAPLALSTPPSAAPTSEVTETDLCDLNLWHLAAGGAGVVGTVAASTVAVGAGWLSPKTSSALGLAAGTAMCAAGWYWDNEYLFAAGIGVAGTGGATLTQLAAGDTYLRAEQKLVERRERKAQEEADKQHALEVAQARALLESEAKNKQRNARRIVVLDHTGSELDQYHDAAKA